MLYFLGGVGTGLVLCAVGIIIAMLLPEPHHSVRPQFFAAVGDRPMLHPNSAAHGAVPSDWSGPIWNPRARMTEVPTRVVRTELF